MKQPAVVDQLMVEVMDMGKDEMEMTRKLFKVERGPEVMEGVPHTHKVPWCR